MIAVRHVNGIEVYSKKRMAKNPFAIRFFIICFEERLSFVCLLDVIQTFLLTLVHN